ncbi:unnamed protein product, partial [Hapterophycus canaliculatus]
TPPVPASVTRSPPLCRLGRIAVMYGSQTGNAQSIAEGIHDGCKKRGLVSTLLACDGWKKVGRSAEAWAVWPAL